MTSRRNTAVNDNLFIFFGHFKSKSLTHIRFVIVSVTANTSFRRKWGNGVKWM